MCPSHTSCLGQKNRGSCRRREIHNLGGFGTILPELRKEHKACVGKRWHIQMEMSEGSQQCALDLPTESEDLLSVFCYVRVLFLSFCSLLRNFFLLYTPPLPPVLLRFAVFLFWSAKLGWKCNSKIYIYETAAGMRGSVVCTRRKTV